MYQPSPSQALAHRENVPLGVLEPGGLRAAGGGDAVLHRHPGHVVLLEFHAPCLELRHLRLHVGDLPIRLAGPGGARVARGVQEDFGAPAFVDHAAGVFLLGPEPDRLLVELPRPRDVGGGDVGANGCGTQHDGLLSRSGQVYWAPRWDRRGWKTRPGSVPCSIAIGPGRPMRWPSSTQASGSIASRSRGTTPP